LTEPDLYGYAREDKPPPTETPLPAKD